MRKVGRNKCLKVGWADARSPTENEGLGKKETKEVASLIAGL